MPNEPWKELVAAYQVPDATRASWQILNTVGTYVALWGLMMLTATISWWLTIPLAAFTGLFLVRVFIILHDCGHGSFFASRRANDFWGFVTGVLSFTPYDQWRGQHAVHHGSTGNLDRRGVGDVWTKTVREYQESSFWKRVAYRVARNPVVLLGIAPLLMLVVDQRIPRARSNSRERRSVWWTNLALLLMATGLSLAMGFLAYLIVQLTVLAVAGGIGVWLFYSQHQFEDAYWERADNWDYADAALKGSAFLKLPRVLQWFTGNIGFHHIHHLNARIPNYNLQACHESHPMFSGVAAMSVFKSLRNLGLKLWDEASRKLVRFREVRRPRSRGYA